MSRGRSERPWPSRSSVITRLPRAARSSASGRCISWESSSPCSRISGRPFAGALRAVRPRPPRGRERRRAAAELRVGEALPLELEERHRLGRYYGDAGWLAKALALHGDSISQPPSGGDHGQAAPHPRRTRQPRSPAARAASAARPPTALLRQGMRVAIGDVDLEAATRDRRRARSDAPSRWRST